MSSPRRSDPERRLAPDWRLPATPADLAALRAVRDRVASPDRYAVLEAGAVFASPPRCDTAAGRAPFRLAVETGRSAGDSGGS